MNRSHLFQKTLSPVVTALRINRSSWSRPLHEQIWGWQGFHVWSHSP